MTHPCIFEVQPDPGHRDDRWTLERCRCHENHWQIHRDDDPPHACPTTGLTASEVRP